MMLKQSSFIMVSALLGFGATQACSSDTSSPTFPTAGAGGASAGTGGSAVSGGGSTAAGSGGASAGSAGAAAGSGGAVAGSGGSSAGAGGSSAGAGGGGNGGAPPATFTSVKAIFGQHCGVGACHSPNGGPHLNYQSDPKGLYAVLTSAIPDTVPYCKGSKVVDGANSLLPKVVVGSIKCGNDTVPQMPEGCQPGDAQRPCLTTAQVKTITDWIAAGAKND